jgi:hypothetical protein
MRKQEGKDGEHRLMGACLKCSIGRTSAKFCDYLQQIYTTDYISRSFIYYGGKLPREYTQGSHKSHLRLHGNNDEFDFHAMLFLFRAKLLYERRAGSEKFESREQELTS